MDDYEYLRASDGTGPAALATIEADRPIDSMVLDVNTTDNYPLKFIYVTGSLLPNGYLDPNTLTEMYCSLDTTTGNINIEGFVDGFVDDGNTANQVGVIKQTAVWANMVTDAAKSMQTFVEEQGDWRLIPHTFSVASGYNKGNRSFELTVPTDLTSLLSPGMRLKLDRSVAAPTQCADLSGTSQYFSKAAPTGVTFTDDFTVEAWVKADSYTSFSSILTRVGTPGTNGFRFFLTSSGQVQLDAFLSSGNSRGRRSIQAVPLGKWVHVAVTLDMSGNTGVAYIDGIAVPSETANNGTATSLTQSGSLVIGAQAAASFFPGEIQDVRLWSTVRTGTEIRDNMYQQLTGTETNLVGYWKLNGDANDSTTNANNLTASGGAGFVTDSAMHDTEYGIITKVAYSAPNSTITVFTPSGYGIPNMALTAPFYSTQKVPFGFPAESNLWSVISLIGGGSRAVAVQTWYTIDNFRLSVPLGAWDLGYDVMAGQSNTSAGIQAIKATLSTSTNTLVDEELTSGSIVRTSSTSITGIQHSRNKYIKQDTDTDWHFLGYIEAGAGTASFVLLASYGYHKIEAKCAYL